MPYKVFNSWLFDGKPDSPISESKNGIDILKYNSPITHTYVISLFLKHGPLNNYLNQYFNNFNLRYLTREELFKFIKKCVHDFKITRRDLMFYKRPAKVILYEKLREKIPELKNDDLMLLCDIIDKSELKDSVYDSLGLDKPKKTKYKKSKKNNSSVNTLKDLLKEHFSILKQ